MNEGEMSARLGMKGIPHIAEEIVNRDIQLATQTQKFIFQKFLVLDQ